MNLLYLKYAATVADCGSISKAAERLYIDQPNLSRSIKDLETSMGVKLFERSARGMKLTPDGEEFLKYARVILSEVDAMENMFRSGDARKQRFSLSVPRASYISEAFAAFSERFSDIAQIEAFYKETNPMRTLKNILEDGYNLGIIRYAAQYDKYYKEMLEEKGLSYELICEFRFVLLTSRSSPIATKETVTEADLEDLTEVLYGDPYVPSMPLDEVRKAAPHFRIRTGKPVRSAGGKPQHLYVGCADSADGTGSLRTGAENLRGRSQDLQGYSDPQERIQAVGA